MNYYSHFKFSIMKTLIIFLFCGSILSANQIFAQNQKGTLLPVVTITAGSNVSDVVQKAFFSKFSKAENMRWFEVNQNYLVKFIMEDQEHHASFRKDGEFLYHISYGDEANLPLTLKTRVQSRYDDYKIGRVFSIDRDDRIVWVVNLESPKRFIVTSIENNDMTEIARYKNATATTKPVASNK